MLNTRSGSSIFHRRVRIGRERIHFEQYWTIPSVANTENPTSSCDLFEPARLCSRAATRRVLRKRALEGLPAG